MTLRSTYFIPGSMPNTADNKDEKDLTLYSEAHGLGQWCTKQGQNCFHNNTKTLFVFFQPSLLQKQWWVKPLGKTP